MMKKTCIQCGKEFELTESEIAFYEEKKLEIPKRCKGCRQANKRKKKSFAGTKRKRAYSEENKDMASEYAEKTQTEENKDTVSKNMGKTQKAESERNIKEPVSCKNAKEYEMENKVKAESVEQENKTGKEKPVSNKKRQSLWGVIAGVAIVIYFVFTGEMPQFSPTANTDVHSSGGYSQTDDGQKEDADSTDKTNEIEFGLQVHTFRNQEYLDSHYEKHGIDMGYQNAEEYLAGANRVVNAEEALHKYEAEDSDEIYYLEETNEIVFVSEDGYIRTYFAPDDGLEYYERQ